MLRPNNFHVKKKVYARYSCVLSHVTNKIFIYNNLVKLLHFHFRITMRPVERRAANEWFLSLWNNVSPMIMQNHRVQNHAVPMSVMNAILSNLFVRVHVAVAWFALLTAVGPGISREPVFVAFFTLEIPTGPPVALVWSLVFGFHFLKINYTWNKF